MIILNRTKIILFSLLLLHTYTSIVAQSTLVQNIKGKVIDAETKTPLFGATIVIANDSTSNTMGGVTDYDGNYKIAKVPVGRHRIAIRCLGYKETVLSNIVVSSAKEMVLNVELQARIMDIKEITVSAGSKADVINEMATVSARTFTVEETQRYAGSRDDAARMASNFAGVQGGDDSRNDIVIRGNSPWGVLWKLDGVDIVNPNHFAVPGTTGSAINLLNSKTFANSDFMTGAFPAEYGNAIAGVFDLRLRNGNNEHHEFTAQLGFLGTELLAEGPISRTNGSSYLATYRYSTFQVFSALSIPIGTSAVPKYQDGTIKINLPTKRAGNFTIFGVGGKSDIEILVSDKTEPTEEIYGDKDRDQYFGSSTFVGGVSHTFPLGKNTYMKTVLSHQLAGAHAYHELVIRNPDFSVDTLLPKLNYKFATQKTSLAWFINTRIKLQHIIKAGINVDRFNFNMADSNYLEKINVWDNRLDYNGDAFLVQPYIQYKYKITDVLSINGGIHAQLLTINENSKAIEPRVGINWQVSEKSTVSAGYGMHSQMLPDYIYFAHRKDSAGKYNMLNNDLKFFNSQHIVLGYDYSLNKYSRIKIETYYQSLSNIPVEIKNSSYSILNQGSSFSRIFPDSLVNAGAGENYGIEFTLERFFNRNFFFLFTSSLYNSTYKGSDGEKRNTDFNGNFIVNALAAREYKLGKKNRTTLTTGAKVTWAGGQRYTPADVHASNLAGELVVIDSLRNVKKFKDYFRLDFKLGIKVNTKKFTHEIALDLVNILNTKNVLGLTYVPVDNASNQSPLREEYQLGFLPLFYYKIDF